MSPCFNANIITMKFFISYFTGLLLCSCIPMSAQDNKDFFALGYATKSSDYILEPALYGIQYKRTQKVLNEQTKEAVFLTDTLLLAIGQRTSVFFNTTYVSRSKAWSRQNIKKSKQSTKASSLVFVPLASVMNKKDASDNYVENDCGEPIVIYKERDRMETTTFLWLQDIECTQRLDAFRGWEIRNVQDTILSYVCTRADIHYAGRDYAAWYTFEIPIPDGPWKFQGLPGLILKAEDKEGLFRFEAIGLETLYNSFITKNNDCDNVDLDYFNKVAQEERSIRKGSFLFDGEVIFTEWRPYSFYEMERKDD